ncbi:MAG: TonB-dependent receptor, partial [Rhodothermales bacterium]
MGRPATHVVVRLCALLLALVFVSAAPTAASAQGKIAGRVTEAGTNQPLAGVNVFIEGTQQGTTTDADGNYVVVNVRPGEYVLVFSFIGFRTQRMTDVRVVTGQTTRIDMQMREEIIEGEEIVVQAQRPLVQKDLTASRKTVVAEDIDALPVESLFDVLQTQAGVTTGADGSIHIRGGRSNEVSYLVDGLSVGNPFETNGLATSVATDAIQEMTVISGAFNAEYGKAMSGIVNLVTKEGGDSYRGSFSAYGGDNVTRHGDVFFSPDGVTLNSYTLEGSLAGPVPLLNGVSFFVSGRHDRDDGHIFGRRQHLPSDSANFNSNPIYYEIHGRPWTDYLDGEAVPDDLVAMNPRQSANVLGKLTARPFSRLKIEYSYLYDQGKRTPFSFGYRFNPDGVASIRDHSNNHSLHLTHTVSDRMFYTVRSSYAWSEYSHFLYEDPADPRYVSTGRIVGFPGLNFLMGGTQNFHLYESSRSVRARFDLTRQMGIIHEAKVGIDMQLHWLDRQNFTILYD